MKSRGAKLLERANKVGIILFVLCFYAASSQLLEGAANAAMWSGRAAHYGYFDNKFGDSNSPYTCPAHKSDGPVIDNNCYAKDAIPKSVNSPMKMYNFLFDKYANPGTYGNATWDKVGVSFIVNTMLGRSPNQSSATLTGADWADLKLRLSSPDVSASKQVTNTNAYGGIDSYYQYLNNDVAYYNDRNFSGEALVFTQAGRVVYVLYYSCANPVGNLPGFRQVNQWSVSTSSTTNVSQVLPGQVITWKHGIKNNGPDSTDQDVTYQTKYGGNLGNGTADNHLFSSGKGNGATDSFTSTYKAKSSDLGTQVCEATSATPQAWDNGGTVTSSYACVNVIYQYELTPHATFNGNLNQPAEAGSTNISVNQSLDNSGPTDSKPTSWVLTRCTYAPGVPAATYNATVGLTGSPLVAAGCVPVLNSPSQTVYTSGNGQVLPTKDFESVPANTAAGTHICYVTSVNPPGANEAINLWKHSVPACLSISKYPKVQALGADIRAGTVKTHSATFINGKFYGSWSEYGIFGIAGIGGMASGSSLAQGGASNSGSNIDALTFANVNTPGCAALGCFYASRPTDDYYTAYMAQPGVPAGNTAGGLIQNGTHEIRQVTGNLTITANLTYTGSYPNPAEIPRVIYVVSGNILVDPSVTQIDVWLISKGTLYTCSNFTDPATQTITTASPCNQQQLTFNGPVTVRDTVLGRSFGSDNSAIDPGKPAEVFNLSPGNYLSNYTASISSSNIQTVYEKELPPRW